MRLSQHGDFSKEILNRARRALSFQFSEADFDFGQACQRPDGSVYGTTGQDLRVEREHPGYSDIQTVQQFWK